jgi:uncharacterized repeat protein (TIGR03943 family)
MSGNLAPLEALEPSPQQKLWPKRVLAWLDLLAILSWGAVLVKYWVTQKLFILIHPSYFGFTLSAGVVLLLIALWRSLQLLMRGRDRSILEGSGDHIRLLPAGWCSVLLILTASVALAKTPQVFNSQSAFQRGLADPVGVTRSHAQAFRLNTKSEDRSLIEWVRTLNVNPEPDSYVGQKAKVQGLVVYPSDLSQHYILVTRFVLTCCAADAYPVSITAKLRYSEPRASYPVDTWVEVEGRMVSETLNGKRQIVLEAQKVSAIPAPKNPYEY